MIDRHSVIEYINKHPTHSKREMRLHFLQTVRQSLGTVDRTEHQQQQISLGAVINQLNYILRDLEASGKIPPRLESVKVDDDTYYS
jgi:hypothetical protein